MSQEYKINLLRHHSDADICQVILPFLPRKGDYLSFGEYTNAHLVTKVDIFINRDPIEYYVFVKGVRDES